MKISTCFIILSAFTSVAVGVKNAKIRTEIRSAEERYPFRVVDLKNGEDIPIKSAAGGAGPHIVNGEEADPFEIPYQAAIFINGVQTCGGSLIGPRWVLTAAHCINEATRVLVKLGIHSISKDAGESRWAKRLFIHGDFNRPELINDIAIIELTEEVKYSDYIEPVEVASDGCVVENNDPLVGVIARTSGWGLTASVATASDVLMKVEVQVISNEKCAEQYIEVLDSHLCTNTTTDIVQGLCQGDSGGPLIRESDGKQIGINSFASSDGCDYPFHPHGYARVPCYEEWIRFVTTL